MFFFNQIHLTFLFLHFLHDSFSVMSEREIAKSFFSLQSTIYSRIDKSISTPLKLKFHLKNKLYSMKVVLPVKHVSEFVRRLLLLINRNQFPLRIAWWRGFSRSSKSWFWSAFLLLIQWAMCWSFYQINDYRVNISESKT